MNDERLAELKEKYKNRNLLEELAWGVYADHSGYTSKQNGEFLNWLCMKAYKALKERPQGEWINREAVSNTTFPFWERYECNKCHKHNGYSNYCPNCGADMRGGRE